MERRLFPQQGAASTFLDKNDMRRGSFGSLSRPNLATAMQQGDGFAGNAVEQHTHAGQVETFSSPSKKNVR